MPKSWLGQADSYMWLKLSTFEGLEPLVLVSEVGYHATEPKMRELSRKKLLIFKVMLHYDEMTSCFPFSVSQNSPIDTAENRPEFSEI